MKLLFVHQTLGQFGGAEVNIHLTAEELGRRGFQSDLLHSRRTGKDEPTWSRVFRQCVQLAPSARAEHVAGLLRREQYDVIYLHNLEENEVVAALLDSGVPVVRMVHDHSLYCMRSYKYNYFTRRICTRPASGYCVFPCLASLARSRGGRFPLRWVSYREKQSEIALNRRCRALVVYSDYQRQELVRNGFQREKVVVCAPIRMLDVPEHSRVSQSSNLILYAGQIIRGKGVDELLQALALVRSDFRCLIFGDGNHRPNCERLSRRLGLATRVAFQGYCPPAQLQRYYREARVFVMSSLWPEPFGMAGPEAMRYGLPVVAFDAGGIREWLLDGENGYLVGWDDVAAFAARIDELLSNPERAAELGRRAQEQVTRYDSSRQIDILSNLFERIGGGPKRHSVPARQLQENEICL